MATWRSCFKSLREVDARGGAVPEDALGEVSAGEGDLQLFEDEVFQGMRLRA